VKAVRPRISVPCHLVICKKVLFQFHLCIILSLRSVGSRMVSLHTMCMAMMLDRLDSSRDRNSLIPELRPGLPPRPGMSELNKKDFLSFKPASAPAAVAAEPMSRSHTPPKRSTPSGNKQVWRIRGIFVPLSGRPSSISCPSPNSHGSKAGGPTA
jgi:hypothetical protein